MVQSSCQSPHISSRLLQCVSWDEWSLFIMFVWRWNNVLFTAAVAAAAVVYRTLNVFYVGWFGSFMFSVQNAKVYYGCLTKNTHTHIQNFIRYFFWVLVGLLSSFPLFLVESSLNHVCVFYSLWMLNFYKHAISMLFMRPKRQKKRDKCLAGRSMICAVFFLSYRRDKKILR